MKFKGELYLGHRHPNVLEICHNFYFRVIRGRRV